MKISAPVYLIVGVLLGVFAMRFGTKPIPPCPDPSPCPDAILQVQPFRWDSEQLKKVRGGLTINYSPQYSGNVVICDSMQNTQK